MLLNRGGDLVPAAERPVRPATGFIRIGSVAPVFADIDGDGDLDMLVPGERDLDLFLNDGRGGFREAPSGRLPVSVNGAPFYRASAGDIDGDGHPDLVIGARWVLANNGSGSFSAAPLAWSTTAPAADSATRSVLVDLDGDGDLDLLTAEGGVAQNVGGSLVDHSSVVRFDGPSGASAVATDWDGDGDLDVIRGDQFFAVPNQPALLGAPLVVQGIVPHPAGLAVTNVIDTVIY